MLSQLLLRQLNELRVNHILCDLELVAGEQTSFHVHQIVFIAMNRRHFQLALKKAERHDNAVVPKKMYLGSLTAEELKLLVEFMYGSTIRKKSMYDRLMVALKKVDMIYLLEEAGEFILEDDDIPIKTEVDNLPLENSALVSSETTEQRQNEIVCENTNENRTSEIHYEVDQPSVALDSTEIKQEPFSPGSSLCINDDNHHAELEKSFSETSDLGVGPNTDTMPISENPVMDENKTINSDLEINELCNTGRVITQVKVEPNSDDVQSENCHNKCTKFKNGSSTVLSHEISSGDAHCKQSINDQKYMNGAVVIDNIRNMQNSYSPVGENINSPLIKMRKLLPRPFVYIYPGPPPKVPSSTFSSTAVTRAILPSPGFTVYSAKTSTPTLTSSVVSMSTLNSTHRSIPSLVSSVVSVSSFTSTSQPTNVLPSSQITSNVLTSGSQTYSTVYTRTISASSPVELTSEVTKPSPVHNGKPSVTLDSTVETNKTNSNAKVGTNLKLVKRKPLFKKSKNDEEKFSEECSSIAQAFKDPANDFESNWPKSLVFEKEDGTESNDLQETEILVESAAAFLRMQAVAVVKTETDNSDMSDTYTGELNKEITSSKKGEESSGVGLLERPEDSFGETLNDNDKPVESESQKCIIPSSEILTLTFDSIMAAKSKIEMENYKGNNSGISSPAKDMKKVNVSQSKDMNRQVLKNFKSKVMKNKVFGEKQIRTLEDTDPPTELNSVKSSSVNPSLTQSPVAAKKVTEVNAADIGRLESIQISNEISSIKTVSGSPKYLGKLFQSKKDNGNMFEQAVVRCNQSEETGNITFIETADTDGTVSKKKNLDVVIQGDRHKSRDVFKESHFMNKVHESIKSALQNENIVYENLFTKMPLDMLNQERDLLTNADKNNEQTGYSVNETATESEHLTNNDDLQKTTKLLESDLALHRILEVPQKNRDDIGSSDKIVTDKESKIIDNGSTGNRDGTVFVNKYQENISGSFHDFITPVQGASKTCIIPVAEICTLSPDDVRAAIRKKVYDSRKVIQDELKDKSNEKTSVSSVPRNPNVCNSLARSNDQREKIKDLNTQTATGLKLKETGNECLGNGKETTQRAEIKSVSEAVYLKNQQSSDSNVPATRLLNTTGKRNDFDYYVQQIKTESDESGISNDIDRISVQEESRYHNSINTDEARNLERLAMQEIYACEADTPCPVIDESDNNHVNLNDPIKCNKGNADCITEKAEDRNFPQEQQKMQSVPLPSVSFSNTEKMTTHKSLTNNRNISPKVPFTVVRFPISVQIGGQSNQVKIFPVDKPVIACFLSPNCSKNAVEKVGSEEKRKRHKSLQEGLSFEKERNFKRMKHSSSHEHMNRSMLEEKTLNYDDDQFEKNNSDTDEDLPLSLYKDSTYSSTDEDLPLSLYKDRIYSAKLISNCDASQTPLPSYRANGKKSSETVSLSTLVETTSSGYRTYISATQMDSASKYNDKNCDDSVKGHEYKKNAGYKTKIISENETFLANNADDLETKQTKETDTSNETERCPFILNEDLFQVQSSETRVSEMSTNLKNMDNVMIGVDDTYQNTGKECMLKETDSDKYCSVVDLTLTEHQSSTFSLGIPGVIQESKRRRGSISETTPEIKKALMTEVIGDYLGKSRSACKSAAKGHCKVCNSNYMNCLIDSESGLCHVCLHMQVEQRDAIKKKSIKKKSKHSKNLLTKEEFDSNMKSIQEKLLLERCKRSKVKMMKQRKESLKRKTSLNDATIKTPADTVSSVALSPVVKQSSNSLEQIPDSSLEYSIPFSVISSQSASVQCAGETLHALGVNATHMPLACEIIPTKVTSSLFKESTVMTARPALSNLSTCSVSPNRSGAALSNVLTQATLTSSLLPNFAPEKSANILTTASCTLAPVVGSSSSVLSSAYALVSPVLLPTLTTSTAVLSSNTRFPTVTSPAPVLTSILSQPVPKPSVLIFKSEEEVQRHQFLVRSDTGLAYKSANVSDILTTALCTLAPVVGSSSSVLSSANALVSPVLLPTRTSSTAVLTPVASQVLSSNARFPTVTSPAPVLTSALSQPVPKPSVLIFKSAEEVQRHLFLVRSDTGLAYRKLQPNPRGYFYPPFS